MSPAKFQAPGGYTLEGLARGLLGSRSGDEWCGIRLAQVRLAKPRPVSVPRAFENAMTGTTSHAEVQLRA